ncbi:fap1 adhesin-like [Puntigrus tetrazona]|uniref:fap1 adhesin-like n=1 Tax=Puntigrus tetrazona TaxID=1606681 RepID=UPI001C89CF49|nr:fap1 adhesin-like [Puntigrus tetrazona]
MFSGGFRSKNNVQGCSLGCESGSMNLGILKSTYFCCGTSFCNANDAPDPNAIVGNGKTCYYCDGDSCSNILRCSGTEDRCITATKAVGGRDTVVKGCVSKVICDSKTLANSVEDVSCCKGNLCNGDESVPQSVTQSFIQNDDESVTQSFIQNVTQSFIQNVDESVTQSFIQSVTQSFVYDSAKIVKPNDAKRAMYSDNKSAKKSFMYNDANSVSQSFLFLCCSLFSFILLH